MAKIVARSSAWPDEVRTQVNAVDTAAKSGDLDSAATRTSFLRNVLMRLPEYRRDLAVIKPPPGEEATPFTHFLKLEAPVFTAAPADTTITFKPEWVTAAGAEPADWIGAISLSGSGAPVIATATGREVSLTSGATFPFPGGPSNTPPAPRSILPVDFNYDFKTDLILAGEGGIRFFRQDSPQAFTDVTSETKLPPATLNHSFEGAWSADIEADGDLDIVLEGYSTAPVLRNNGDGTFTEMQPFPKIEGVKGFAWADIDADGDPDAAIIDVSYKLHIFSNERQGQFTERPLPAGFNAFANAINVMDVDNDGVFDLLLTQGGAIMRLSDKDHGAGWVQTEIVKLPEPPEFTLSAPDDLRVADLDNNGGLDLVLMSSFPHGRAFKCAVPCKPGVLVWLNDGNGKFTPVPDTTWRERVFDVADVNGDGRLDLLGLAVDGKPREAINQARKIITGRSFARAPATPWAISVSIRSAWVARWRSAPVCSSRNNRSPDRCCISDSANKRAPT